MKQSPGSIVQTSFVVDDLRTTANHWANTRIAGPFFLLEHIEINNALYQGQATDPDISIALGYSGGVCVELIQLHNDAPSVYSRVSNSGYPAFHHIAIMTENFDDDVDRYANQGADIEFEGEVAVGGRFAYLNTQEQLGGLLELIELTPVVRELFANIEQAADGWQGESALRKL